MIKDTALICEVCGKRIEKDYRKDKKHSASHPQRFCSRSCANTFSSRSNRVKKNQKIRESLKGRLGSISWKKTPEIMKRRIEKQRKTCYEKRSNQLYKTGCGDILNKTRGEIELYRETHTVCEICGRENILSGKKVNLCIDHNHKDNTFRGVLCQLCNRQLGWYENNREKN